MLMQPTWPKSPNINRRKKVVVMALTNVGLAAPPVAPRNRARGLVPRTWTMLRRIVIRRR